MGYRKWIRQTVLMIASSLTFIGLLTYIVDPFQFYRKPFYDPFFSGEGRYLNPELARNYDYDTIVIGTSYSENFIPSYIDEKLNVKTLNLPIAGSVAREQSLTADVALRTGKVKNVIWEIHYTTMKGNLNNYPENKFPIFLYDENFLNDYKYLLNTVSLKHIMKTVVMYYDRSLQRDLGMRSNWNKKYKFSKDEVKKSWEKAWVARKDFLPEEYTLKKIKNNFDANVYALVERYDSVNFTFFYPPNSVLMYKFLDRVDKVSFNNVLLLKKYIFNKLSGHKNVKIFDFNDDKEITFNLDNYKDIGHYSQKINEYIIDSMASDKNRVTAGNIDRRLDALNEQVQMLDITDILRLQ